MRDLRDQSTEWIVRHGRFLRRVSRAILRDEASAEDAVQDAWVAALEDASPRNPLGWLTTVTRRLALRAGRSEDRRRSREHATARPEALPATDSAAARSEIVRLVGEVVAELPEPFRETLLLRFWEGLPPRAVAERTGVPVATVRSRTRRGLERVRAELERRAPRTSRWQADLALATGLFRPGGGASTITSTLGALAVKTKTWIACAAALALFVVTAVVTVAVDGGPWSEAPVERVARPRTSRPVGTTPSSRDDGERSVLAPEREVVAGSAAAPAPPTIAVRVVTVAGDPVGGAELLGGADVSDLRLVARTDAEGRARLTAREGLEVLCARADGWTPSPVHDLRSEGRPVARLVLRLPRRGASLEVAVTDPGGRPLAGARVFAGREEVVEYRLADGSRARTAPGFEVSSDASGTARFAALSPGWLRVSVEHEAYAGSTTFATLEVGRPVRLEVRLQDGIFVAGTVRDERGAPVAGARVRRGSAGTAARTDAGGCYELGPVGAGKVVVEGPLGRRAERRVSGSPGERVTWDPVLPSDPAVRGRVLDGSGAPLAGWTVHANRDTWPGWRSGTTTDDSGRFAIHAPPEGELRLEVRERPGDALPVLWLEGAAAGPDEVLLRVYPGRGARVVGAFVLADPGLGEDLPAYLRHVTTPGRQRLTGGRGLALAADERGAFAVEALPAGEYEVVLEGEPFGWFRLARFTVRGEGTVDLGGLDVPTPGTLRARTWWGTAEPTVDASYLLERRDDEVTVAYFRGAFPTEMRLAPGRYTLQTEVTPGPQRELAFEVRAGSVTDVELDLRETCLHAIRVRYASRRVPAGGVDLRIRREDDDVEHLERRVTEIADDAWTVDVELPAGRFELTARGPDGLQVREAFNLYTSRPGRELVLTLDDVGARR